MSSAATALRAIAERYIGVLVRTYQAKAKKMVVKPVGIATRKGAEKSFQPQATKESAAEKSRKIPRKSIPCKARSERSICQRRSRRGIGGGAGAVGLTGSWGSASGRGATT